MNYRQVKRVTSVFFNFWHRLATPASVVHARGVYADPAAVLRGGGLPQGRPRGDPKDGAGGTLAKLRRRRSPACVLREASWGGRAERGCSGACGMGRLFGWVVLVLQELWQGGHSSVNLVEEDLTKPPHASLFTFPILKKSQEH